MNCELPHYRCFYKRRKMALAYFPTLMTFTIDGVRLSVAHSAPFAV